MRADVLSVGYTAFKIGSASNALAGNFLGAAGAQFCANVAGGLGCYRVDQTAPATASAQPTFTVANIGMQPRPFGSNVAVGDLLGDKKDEVLDLDTGIVYALTGASFAPVGPAVPEFAVALKGKRVLVGRFSTFDQVPCSARALCDLRRGAAGRDRKPRLLAGGVGSGRRRQAHRQGQRSVQERVSGGRTHGNLAPA